MAIALVTHTLAQSADTNTVTTSSIDTTGADLLVVAVTWSTGGTFTNLTDSKTNTWTQLTAKTASGVSTSFFYAKNATVGSGHTFSANGTAFFPSIAVAAFSGSDLTAPVDVENGGTTASGTSLATGSVTPGQDNELVIFACGDAWTGTIAVDVGSITDQAAIVGGTAFALAMAYQIQTTATARNPSWSWSPAARAEAVIATFKAAAVAANTKRTYGTVFG